VAANPDLKINHAILLTNGFDCDQVWEQLMLFNRNAVKYLSSNTEKMITQNDLVPSKISTQINHQITGEAEIFSDHDSEISHNIDIEENMEDFDNEDSMENQSDVEEKDEEAGDIDIDDEDKEYFNQKTPLDDDFFSLREMEKFSLKGEKWDLTQQDRQFLESEDDSDSEEEGGARLLKKKAHPFDLGLGY
jgi:hypothetical protein